MKKFLITGGPVHAHLDSVKIITNSFKGGFLSELATQLSTTKNANIIYLCNRSSKIPANNPGLKVIYHNGFDDYMEKVLEIAPKMDAVILGAAVANLIPYKTIDGKFPSHNYKPGDLVPLIFRIAPRIIDEVKKVAPNTHLFGFKLLDNVSHEELIRAAYGVLLESKATAIVANDWRDLTQKYVVTKERAVHPINYDNLLDWMWDAVNDLYYSTEIAKSMQNNSITEINSAFQDFESFIKNWNGFIKVPEGFVFGTVAKRCGKGFWTTGRGKVENSSYVFVGYVDHINRIVHSVENKASLNAPLLSHIFSTMLDVDLIAHSHKCNEKYPTLPYAPAGTVRDSIRKISGSFNIENHGSFTLLDKDRNPIYV
jgi:hypothetical protein